MAVATDEKQTRPPAKKHLRDIANRCTAMGLSPEILEQHQIRIAEFIAAPQRHFPIADTCTLSNQGILALETLSAAALPYDSSGVVALVPAAGAASRYVAPLESVSGAARSQDKPALRAVLDSLRLLGAEKWAAPTPLPQILANPKLVDHLTESDWKNLSTLAEMPKALFPCTAEGSTFLQWKIREHQAIGGFSAQVFVTPPSGQKTFEASLSISELNRDDIRFVEQSGLLSTLRFKADGSPALDEKGLPSMVPAGHGALTRLFEDVRVTVKGASSLFIRNIDNVSGSGEPVSNASRDFLRAFSGILERIRSIREALLHHDFDKAAATARDLLRLLALNLDTVTPAQEGAGKDSLAILWILQERLFHTSYSDLPQGLSELDALNWVYSRPFNLLGQVPNSGKDVGGTPVFLSHSQPSTAPKANSGACGNAESSVLARPRKICIELPHASEQDVQVFLRDPMRATHFNPVFIAAEIPADPSWYDGGFDRINLTGKHGESGHPFWLVAKKTWRGETVYYHESLLSEILGNSTLTNFIFVEIPRSLFNPHKSLADSVGRHDSDWL